MTDRIYIGKCPVDCIRLVDTLERINEAITNDRRLLVAPVNAATVVSATRIDPFRIALNEMDILLPDGYWLQVAARLLRYPTTNHVATVPLTYHVLQKLGRQRGTVYLLGAKDFVVCEAAKQISRRFGVEIAGVRNGYFDDTEEEDVIQQLNKTKPHLLLIGISSPKKELFMARNRKKLQIPVTIGVGGLIDILGGKTDEGPTWLRNYGLMWLYRFSKEPKRLWKRYTVTNFQFILLVFKQALRIHHSRGL